MSKRNFILLTIVLIIIVAVVFGFLYFRKGATLPGEDGTGTNFLSQFNPFGSGTKTPPATTPPADVSGYEPTPKAEVKLKKVSSMPIAGFTVYQKERLKEISTPEPVESTTPTSDPSLTLPLAGAGKNSKTIPTQPPTEFMPALRYVARNNGNVYQTFADKLVEKKFSNTIIPKVYEALFGSGGESVFMRYLKADGKTIETFAGNLPKELLGEEPTGDKEIKGSFLPENVKDMSLSPDAFSLFYLFEAEDNIVGTTLDLATNKKTQVFDSAFTEWLSWWPNSKTITLSTKPSSGIPGYMYTLDPSSANNKGLTQVLGNINGLTTLMSPDGKFILYGNDNLSLSVYQKDTKTSELLGVRTLPEKCVWGKTSAVVYCAVPKFIESGGYPEKWYQGETSFSDQIWKIDVADGNATILVDPITIEGGEEIDGIKLMVDDSENYLFFVNKKDSFLWELKLN